MGRALYPQTLASINAALVAAPHVAQLQAWPDGSFTRTTEHPVTQLVEHAMSIIAEDAAALLSSDEAQLLTRCEAEPCTRFYLRAGNGAPHAAGTAFGRRAHTHVDKRKSRRV